ncbi:MAG: anaerobic sulfite reductase subunit AsrB, partial [Faecalibacillus sp.]
IYTLDNDKIDGWNTGFVTEFIPKINFDEFDGDYEMIIVGPPPMMKFSALAAMKAGVPVEKIWVSFERKMSCAVGKCGHCRIDEVYVCLDGPVFNYTVAKDLID